jgi:hypothetical protein
VTIDSVSNVVRGICYALAKLHSWYSDISIREEESYGLLTTLSRIFYADGVWEDITIDKLADYSSLVDSD